MHANQYLNVSKLGKNKASIFHHYCIENKFRISNKAVNNETISNRIY